MDDEHLINTILTWMKEMGYGDKDGHSPAIILAGRIQDTPSSREEGR